MLMNFSLPFTHYSLGEIEPLREDFMMIEPLMILCKLILAYANQMPSDKKTVGKFLRFISPHFFPVLLPMLSQVLTSQQ